MAETEDILIIQLIANNVSVFVRRMKISGWRIAMGSKQ